MITIHCHIHNADFKFPESSDEGRPWECPYCLMDERNSLKAKLSEVVRQRDILLATIDLKKTITMTLDNGDKT